MNKPSNKLVTVLFIFVCATSMYAETCSENVKKWSDGWKHSFSSEGRKQWKPEFTARYTLGVFASEAILSAGVRVDEKRTFGLMVGHISGFVSYAPGHMYLINTEVFMRRYFHLGKKKRFAFYSDISLGAEGIYKITGKYRTDPETGERREIIKNNTGDIHFSAKWQPGIRLRIYKNLHIFLGPTLSTNYIYGAHIGIGF